MKTLLFIFNPKAGKGQIKNKLMDILDMFVKNSYHIRVFVTQKSGDGRSYVETFGNEVDLVICSGGDGTLNETISGLMTFENPPTVGYIPTGSTNDFASSLKIPKNMLLAAKHAILGKELAIDIGHFCEQSFFVYVAAFGAFTEVSYMTSQDSKNLLGHPAYTLEAVKRLSQLKSHQVTIRWDESEMEGEFILGMVTNTISIGGFKGLVNQEVALDDGEFEVLLVKTPKKPKDFQSIASYLFFKEGENDCVFTFRTRKIHLAFLEPVDWTIDGEYGGTHQEVMVENRPKAIKIKIPPDGK